MTCFKRSSYDFSSAAEKIDEKMQAETSVGQTGKRINPAIAGQAG
jgi:hypothetical protein